MLMMLISFFFVFTIITLTHEFAHLYFSKKAGIRVLEFGIGFGPTLFSVTKNDTIYRVNALPILGYVKIAGIDGDDDQEKQTPETEKYYTKTPWQKFVAISAGAIANILLGALVYSLVFMFIGMPAGISSEISTVSPGSIAEKSGIRSGDVLLSLDNKTYKDPKDLISVIHKSKDKQITLKIKRNGQTLEIKAKPAYNPKLKVSLLGFTLRPVYQKINPLQAVYHGFKETFGLMAMISILLVKLLTGQVALGDLAGPIGIAQISGQYAQQGPAAFLGFLAFFSINVGLLNLFPIPALDGGRIVFVLIEAIFRRPVPIGIENKIHLYGMYALLTLMAIISINDILRLFR